MIVFMTVLSALAGLAFLVVLATGALRIAETLEAIGAREPPPRGKKTSFLCRIRFGVRAIETQTGHLGPQVTRLNDQLEPLAAGLGSLRDTVARIDDAVKAQGR